MELYDFIRNDFPMRASQREVAAPLVLPAEVQPPAPVEAQEDIKSNRGREAEEALATLQQALEAATVEREMMQHRIAALESHLDDVENTRNELELQLQTAEADRNSIHETARYLREKAESFTVEREELLGRIDTLESQVSSLETARQALERQAEVIAAEKDDTLREISARAAEKAEEIEQLKSERDNALYESLSQATQKTEEIEQLRSERDNALREAAALTTERAAEIEHLKAANITLQQEKQKSLAAVEAVENENQACLAQQQSMQKETSIYKTLLIICIVAMVATLGLIVYLYFDDPKSGGRKNAAAYERPLTSGQKFSMILYIPKAGKQA